MKTSAHTRSPDRAISSALLERLRAARCASGYEGAHFDAAGQFVSNPRASVLLLSEPNLSLPHASTRQHTATHGSWPNPISATGYHPRAPSRTYAHLNNR